MGIGNLHILAQVTAYLLAVIFSVFVCAPLIINVTEFNGQCLLYAQGHWNNESNSYLTNVTESDSEHGASHGEIWQLTVFQWGNIANCNFPIFVGIVSFTLALLYIFWYSVHLYKATEPSWLVAFINLVVNSALSVLTLIAAVITMVGFQQWCSLIQQHFRCDIAEFLSFDVHQGINTTHFNLELAMAQFGLWTLLITWFVQVILASYQMYRYHKHESFFISIQREQARLLGKMHADPAV